MQATTITAAQIHEDFYGAEERLFVEAIGLTQNSIPGKSLVPRFQKIGFKNVKAVKETAALEQKKAASESVISAIEYFRTYYPQYKFITEAEVKKLCEKYGLVLGDAVNFTGDMPEKNLVDVENFKLRKEDWKERQQIGDTFSWLMPSPSYLDGFGQISRSRRDERSDFIEAQRQLAQYLQYPTGSTYDNEKKTKLEKEQPTFKICAPKEDFNTMGYEIKDGYRLVYDPIVLQPVSKDGIDGYLIVTAWGDEAKDELVISQDKN